MLNELTNSINLIVKQTQNNIYILAILLFIPWFLFVISYFITNKIVLLGIIPRYLRGIPGIFFAPLLHANFNHLFFNSIPLVVLSNFILIGGLHYYLLVTLLITVLSGTAIWCFAKPGIYIGASALITGYWGFLVSNMYQKGSLTTVILGVISLYYFAGIFLGVFPGKKGVAWQGHLFGLLAGFGTSFFLLKFYPFFY